MDNTTITQTESQVDTQLILRLKEKSLLDNERFLDSIGKLTDIDTILSDIKSETSLNNQLALLPNKVLRNNLEIIYDDIDDFSKNIEDNNLIIETLLTQNKLFIELKFNNFSDYLKLMNTSRENLFKQIENDNLIHMIDINTLSTGNNTIILLSLSVVVIVVGGLIHLKIVDQNTNNILNNVNGSLTNMQDQVVSNLELNNNLINDVNQSQLTTSQIKEGGIALTGLVTGGLLSRGFLKMFKIFKK